MKKDSYLIYLETLVVSLLAERKKKEADIVDADPQAPPFAKGFTFSPILVKEEIAKQRLARQS